MSWIRSFSTEDEFLTELRETVSSALNELCDPNLQPKGEAGDRENGTSRIIQDQIYEKAFNEAKAKVEERFEDLQFFIEEQFDAFRRGR
jgi:hypothetical protein